ncbi:putative heterokaryon incompatibility protein 6, OR allele, partial [Xylogone sp. PMI_703]
RVGDTRFSDAVVLLKNGIKYIMENHIKYEVQQFLANRIIKESVKGRTVVNTKLSSETIGKSLGRLPFISRKGHLVLSSEHVKQGDVIALINGTQVPFILRRQSGEAYQLIGDAYVDGIMGGEAAKNTRFGVMRLVSGYLVTLALNQALNQLWDGIAIWHKD